MAMSDERRVRFGKMKLLGLAKVWWNAVEGDMRRFGQPPMANWQEIKAKLREKYMPPNYQDKICDQLVFTQARHHDSGRIHAEVR